MYVIRHFPSWSTYVWLAGFIVTVLTLVNAVHTSMGTTRAIPFAVFSSSVAIWFALTIPLTCVGGFLAVKTPMLKWPATTEQTPSHTPPARIAANPYVLYAAAGVLPFCAVFIELYFAMASMWQGYLYNFFGFSLTTALLAVLVTIQVSVLCTCAPAHCPYFRWQQRMTLATRVHCIGSDAARAVCRAC